MVIILLLSGKSGSGKDTFYNLTKNYKNIHVYRYAFADDVKSIARTLGWDGLKDQRGLTLLQSISYSVREYDENFWIKRLFKNIRENHDLKSISAKTELLIITDCRYRNQINYFLSNHKNTYTVRVERQNLDSNLTDNQKNHPCETDLDNFDKFDFIITNNGTIDEYQLKATSIIESIFEKI